MPTEYWKSEAKPTIILVPKSELDAVRNFTELHEKAKELGAFFCITSEFHKLKAFDGKANVIAYLPDDDLPETKAMLRYLLDENFYIKPIHFSLITRNDSVIETWRKPLSKHSLCKTLAWMGQGNRSYLGYLPHELQVTTRPFTIPAEKKVVILHAFRENSIDFAQKTLPRFMRKENSGISFFCINNPKNFIASSMTKIFVYPTEFGMTALASRISSFVANQQALGNENIYMLTRKGIGTHQCMAEEIERILQCK